MGKFINVVIFQAHPDKEGTTFDGKWACPVDKDECIGMFKDWEPEVVTLLDVSQFPAFLEDTIDRIISALRTHYAGQSTVSNDFLPMFRDKLSS